MALAIAAAIHLVYRVVGQTGILNFLNCRWLLCLAIHHHPDHPAGYVSATAAVLEPREWALFSAIFGRKKPVKSGEPLQVTVVLMSSQKSLPVCVTISGSQLCHCQKFKGKGLLSPENCDATKVALIRGFSSEKHEKRTFFLILTNQRQIFHDISPLCLTSR